MGPQKKNVNLLKVSQYFTPVAMVRKGEQGSISRDDVAQTLVRSFHDDAAINQTFEIIQGNTLIGKAINEIH